ncbi:unnamed protein product, partial [Mesorhabditis spiculigera]
MNLNCLDLYKNLLFYVRGESLYSHLYESRVNLSLSTANKYAVQICQALSYLHAKNIIHGDLRSKNIFVEQRRRVLVTDVGLFSMKRMKNPHRKYTIITPTSWLPYLAPELITEIADDFRELPSNEETDVYAFGTIWHELLVGRLPWSGSRPETIIWRVGNGVKPRIPKDCPFDGIWILSACWSHDPSDRPSFPELLHDMRQMPTLKYDANPRTKSFESII